MSARSIVGTFLFSKAQLNGICSAFAQQLCNHAFSCPAYGSPDYHVLQCHPG